MSSRLHALPTFGLIALAVVAPVADAQGNSEARGTAAPRTLVEVYRARRDLLLAQAAVDRDSLGRVQAAGRATYSVGAVRGRLTLLTSAAFVDSAARALAAADSLLRTTVFDRASDEPVRLRLHPEWGVAAGDTIERTHWFLDRAVADGAEQAIDWWDRFPNVSTLADVIAFREQDRLHEQLPAAFRNWLNGKFLRLAVTERWQSVYIALATSPTVVSRSCLLGNLPSCRQALQIDRAADPLMEWFTPGARRQMVTPLLEEENKASARAVETKYPGAITACLTAADDDACIKVLLSGPNPAITGDPLRTAAGREALVVAAIEMPGAPGIRAILGRDGLSLNDALTAISGTTVDAVVRRWHQRATASVPDTVELPAPRLISALVWTLVLGACALGGSRWRSA